MSATWHERIRFAAFAALWLLAGSAAAQETLVDLDGYRGLAADHRARQVGDVVTVYVLEATRAKSQAATDASSDTSLQAGLVSPSTHYDASLGISGTDASGAQTTRVGELRTQISARVVGVESGGALRIEGRQALTVNGERQEIVISGTVRPEDIAADNTVWSNRIADADIRLAGAGVVSRSQRQGVFYRVFKWMGLL
jgi:flagellar L-ring protein precursor FlgH